MRMHAFFLTLVFLFGTAQTISASDFVSTQKALQFRLDTEILLSKYKNILGKNVQNEIETFFDQNFPNVKTDSFFIKIKFVEGLKPLQLREKQESGKYFYRTSFIIPAYEVKVLDRDGKIVSEQNYGKEKVEADFGKNKNFQTDGELSLEWRKQRDGFYKTQEENYNNIIAFLEDFKNVVLPKVMIGEQVQNAPIENDEIVEAPEPTLTKEEPIATVQDVEDSPVQVDSFEVKSDLEKVKEKPTKRKPDPETSTDEMEPWKEKKNSIKFSFPAIAYERVLSKKTAVNLHFFYFRFNPPSSGPILNLSDISEKNQNFISAFTFTGEFRFYPGKKQAPRGFYIAPFVRYNKLKLNVTDTDLDDGINNNMDGIGIIRVDGFGGGLQLGAQWVINNTVTIDWGFLGFGAYQARLNARVRSDENVYWEGAAIELNKNFRDTDNPLFENFAQRVNFEADGESAVTDVSGFLPTLRTTLSIGFRF